MKKEIFQNVFFIIAVILYNIFFWQKEMGLNVLLFSVLIIGGLFYLHEEGRDSTIARLTALGTLVTAIGVVIFNSFFSKIIYITSLTVMVGFVQVRELRFFWYGLLTAIWSLLSVPMTVGNNIKITKNQTKWLGQTWRYARLSILPVIVVLAFFGLYRASNAQFNHVSVDVLDGINYYLGSWFANWTPQKIGFFLISSLIIGAMIWKTKADYLIYLQEKHGDTIQRIRKKRGNIFMTSPMTALKNEYRSALILLVTLNVLTFCVNLVDIQNIWFGFAKTSPNSLYSDVHVGTYILIFTVLISIGVLMLFFRGNLNFFKKNKWLKITAFTWLAQNAILVISVALRNIKYIDYFGLTYKRIGVFVFLALVLFGLYTIFLKIKDQRTPYFLFQRNAWCLYIVLVFLSTINWDVWITNYNLSKATTGSVDYYYLVEHLSDKNLAQLYKHEEEILFMAPSRTTPMGNSFVPKTQEFLRDQAKQSWLSWNYADYSTLLYLKEHHLAD